MKSLCILEFGCNNNHSNYYRIINSCRGKYEIVRDVQEADWCIVPFCSCTDKSIEWIKEELKGILERKKATCKVIVTGCIMFVKEEKRSFLRDYKIDYIVPVKNQVEEICKILDVSVNDSIYNEYDICPVVKIGEGCLNKCSFCRIHYSDRPLKSDPIEEIEKTVRNLVENGIKFVTISALNTALYGIDLYGKKSIHVLLKSLSKIEGIEGIILESFSLADAYDEAIEEIKNNPIIIEVRIDIQSGSDKILKHMNVKHTVKDIEKVFLILHEKITYTRIISGFPTENEDDVLETISLLQKLHLHHVVVQPYRNSNDIPAGKMKQLTKEVAIAHYEKYSKAVKEIEKNIMKKENGNTYIGYVSEFSMMNLSVYIPKRGNICMPMKEEYFKMNLCDKVKITLIDERYVLDEILELSAKETIPPRRIENELFRELTNMLAITSNFVFPKLKLNLLLKDMFLYYYNKASEKEVFKSNILVESKEIQEALLRIYEMHIKNQ